MDEIRSTLGLILSLQKDMQKDIGKLDQKIDNVEKSLNERIDKVETSLNERIDKVEENLDHKIERVRIENMMYYMNLDKKLNDNLEDIGEMFRDLYGNIPA